MTAPLPAHLDELREALANATPGPWRVTSKGWIDAGDYDVVTEPGDVDCMPYCYGGTSTIAGDNLAADAALIVAAVNALPSLLSLVREQASDLAHARSAGESYRRQRDALRVTMRAQADVIEAVRRLLDVLDRINVGYVPLALRDSIADVRALLPDHGQPTDEERHRDGDCGEQECNGGAYGNGLPS